VELDDGGFIDVTDLAIWTSSDEEVAIVDAGGVASGEGGGEAEITAVYAGLTDSGTLVVGGLKGELSVEPPAATIDCTEPIQLSATVTFPDTSKSDVTEFAVWSSSDEAIATVSAGLVGGVVTGGPVTITATFAGISSFSSITVNCSP
jgi:uncharacterized protein YjdB